jgi:hypothetical protein
MEKTKQRTKKKAQKDYFEHGPYQLMSREDIMAEDKKARVGFGLHGRDD